MSPRNRIIYLLSNGKEGLYLTLKKCCEFPEDESTIDESFQPPTEEPIRKRRSKVPEQYL